MKTLTVLRVDKPNIGKVRGDVIDITQSTEFVGSAVDKGDSIFVLVNVVDLPIELEEELLAGTKRLVVPAAEDPMSAAITPSENNAGKVTVDTATLLNYVEAVNA